MVLTKGGSVSPNSAPSDAAVVASFYPLESGFYIAVHLTGSTLSAELRSM